MRTTPVALLVLVSVSVVAAQPGMTPPRSVPPAYTYQPPPALLTAEEEQLVLDGEISDGQHAAGVAAAIVVGFGVGQAIEGRWSNTGYIFTFGETATGIAFFYDAATGPTAHNRKVRALRLRIGGPQPYVGRLQPYLLPARGGGGTAGLGFAF